MAVVIYGTPIDAMNLKQLRRIARNSFLSYDLSTSRAALITLINS